MDEAAPSTVASGATGDCDLYVVVPVYNESENFQAFYDSLKRHVRTPHVLLVVYDFEEDTTLPIARAIIERDPSVVLVRNPHRGVVNALRTGLAYPRQGAVVVSMADLSDDHRCIDAMYAMYRQGYDLVAASRYSRGGEQRGGPFLKKVLSRTAGISLHYLAGIPTFDPTNNFKLYSRRLLDGVTLESTGGFEVALELTVKARRLNLRVGEVPTVWTDRTTGESRFRLAKWLPAYLRWYAEAFRTRLGRR
jgi:dolichol-phosphate mannosyltransferase